jgi:serine/threonine protein kinase
MPREIKGVTLLSQAFPTDWLFYVSLNCFPERQRPFEIDAFVVTDSCVLLLEIKDWNGNLTSQGDLWFLGKHNRGRSAVYQVADKARVLKTVLKGHLGVLGGQFEVVSKVVLTGTADGRNLPQSQAQHVWSLAEAQSLGDPNRRKKLLPHSTLKLIKLCSLEEQFDRITGNPKVFQPLEADWAGFQVVEQDLFAHPRGIWRDHRGVRKSEQRIKALIRTWSFDKLPPGLNSNQKRARVAARETQAFGYLAERGSPLISQNRVLRDIANHQDEILTQHFEVRAVEDGWTTLDRYLVKHADEIGIEGRYTLVSALLDIVAELHKTGVTHRDLGPRAFWVGSPAAVALTGLMSCQLPDQGTVADWLPELRGYAPALPEDAPGSQPGTGKQRDVYALGLLAALVLTDESNGADDPVAALPQAAAPLGNWLRRALSAEPKDRFESASDMQSEFSELIEPPKIAFDSSLLDRFETTTNPYLTWVSSGQVLPSRSECTVYVSRTSEGREVTVKIWNQLRRGASSAVDLAIYRLLDSAARLRTAPLPGLPRFVEAGLGPAGPFVVYEHAQGHTLDSIQEYAQDEAVDIVRSLVESVEALHAIGCEHGDIHPANILWQASAGAIVLLDPFDVTVVGDGTLRTPAFCPENWEVLGRMSLDRYACLKVAEHVLSRSAGGTVEHIAAIVRADLERSSVETLEPLLQSLRISGAPKPVAEIELSTFADTAGFEGGRGYFVELKTDHQGRDRVVLTNAGGQLVIEADGQSVRQHFFRKPDYGTFAYKTRAGVPVDIKLTVSRGRDKGFDDLYQTLKVAPPTLKTGATGSAANDVSWKWRRLLQLEEEGRIEVEITEVVGKREGVTLCRYDNLRREFDFDSDALVDVQTTGKRRAGEVDRGLSDFPQILALRTERNVSVGEHFWLVDRREQTSIDRRNRAVTRILDRKSAIPDLIDYFDPARDQAAIDYALRPTEVELAQYSLNEGQEIAFKQLVSTGPVGLLQGPPGTGKTRFIAAFVHWLLTRGGAQRILVASQSHEAVNNAIDALLGLYKRLGGKPKLLRIGSKGITSRIKPYHSTELREQHRLRFAGAAKFRYMQLASAKGIPRRFAAEFFDLDTELGQLARKLNALTVADATSGRSTAEDRERREKRMKRVTDDFQKVAARIAPKVDKGAAPEAVLEAAISELCDRHPEASPSDVAAAKSLVRLTSEWIAALGSPQRNFEEFLAKTRSVVTATCVGVGQSRIRIDAQLFDWVIVDEAARCTSGELAVPIQMARRVLLVGDHLQLRPMVDREILDVLEEESDGEESRGELSASDFERAFTSSYGHQVSCRFTEQYRMDDAICRMVSTCFYKPHEVELFTSPKREGGLKFDGGGANWLKKPISWVDTSGHERGREFRPNGSMSRVNEAEADIVIALLEDISKDRVLVDHLNQLEDDTPIGVICMYAAQKARIESKWLQRPWEARFRRLVRIDTVDSYQGKENEIVIVSLVCGNPHKDIGHVSSANRCNVAFSRARERLAIVGSVDMYAPLNSKTPITTVYNYIKRDTANAAVIPWRDLR